MYQCHQRWMIQHYRIPGNLILHLNQIPRKKTYIKKTQAQTLHQKPLVTALYNLIKTGEAN